MDLDVILDISKNLGKISNKIISFNNNNELKLCLAKDLDFDNKSNNEKLIPLLKKAK